MIALLTLLTVHTFLYFGLWQAIDKNGKIIKGYGAFRAIKENTKDIEGAIDDDYIRALVKKYNNSLDKNYLKKNRWFLSSAGMTKYAYTNYCLNYARYGVYETNGFDCIELHDPFLKHGEDFYREFKKAMKEEYIVRRAALIERNLASKKYNKKQIQMLDQKIEHVKTPFYVAYNEGIRSIAYRFDADNILFFIVLVFALSGIFAKDTEEGINELTSATLYGKKTDMKARWFAGNLFAMIAYVIFWAAIILENAGVASLHGWNASIQMGFCWSVFNINQGSWILIKMFGGLLGALVIANLVMLLSTVTQNIKYAIILGSAVIWGFLKWAIVCSGSWVEMLDPVQFGDDRLVSDYFFGRVISMPYYSLVLIAAGIYLFIIGYFLQKAWKKYAFN